MVQNPTDTQWGDAPLESLWDAPPLESDFSSYETWRKDVAPCLEWINPPDPNDPGQGPEQIGGTVLVFPGGGYRRRAAHEGEAVARFWAEHGWASAVVHYRVFPACFPAPLLDGARAVRKVRERLHNAHRPTHRVAAIGFSAGAHLAATLATLGEWSNQFSDDLRPRFSARPNALMMGYPVISFSDFAHEGSVHSLLEHRHEDEPPIQTLRDLLSLQNQVGQRQPPCFLWHMSTDPVVPVQNALMFAQACWEKEVEANLHVFPGAQHGLGMAREHPWAAVWPKLAECWLRTWFQKCTTNDPSDRNIAFGNKGTDPSV